MPIHVIFGQPTPGLYAESRFLFRYFKGNEALRIGYFIYILGPFPLQYWVCTRFIYIKYTLSTL